MADIFLSYAKEDREVARKLATLLENAGWIIWWDRRIPAGRTWHDVLEEALREMRCMIVLWSSHSIDSDWVKEEAEEARARKKLLPVLIEPVNAPVGFRAIQAADLTDWDGVNESLGSRQLVADLESLIGKPAACAAFDAQFEAPQQAPSAETGAPGRKVSAALAKRPNQAIHDVFVNTSRRWKNVAAAAAVVLAAALSVLTFWPEAQTENKQTAVVTSPSLPEPPAPPKLVKLGVSAPRRELKPAETMNIALRGVFSDGSENDISSAVEWSSSDSRVASVDRQGRVTALQPGMTAITASHSGVTSSAWRLSVQAVEPRPAPPPKLVGLAVIANKTDLAPREKIALRVSGTYSDGSQKNLSSGVLWKSSNTAVASVDAGGELQAWRAGSTEVVARMGEVTSAPVGLDVRQPAAAIAAEPNERKSPEYAPSKAAVGYAAVEKSPEPPPAAPDRQIRAPDEIRVVEKLPETRPTAPEIHPEQVRAKVASYISRAKDYRTRGDYRAALTELGNARTSDPGNAEVRAELEQTRRACLAEKRLGRTGLEC